MADLRELTIELKEILPRCDKCRWWTKYQRYCELLRWQEEAPVYASLTHAYAEPRAGGRTAVLTIPDPIQFGCLQWEANQ